MAGCSTPGSATQQAAREFPTIDTAKLTAYQKRFLKVVRAEYLKPKPATDYAAGITEPWCADFVSWVMRESGAPLRNPNSGGWRIPGIYTLADYYTSVNRFAGPGSGHVPVTGDVLIYGEGSPFGAHTNMVLSFAGGELTTIGGNEGGGIEITTHPLTDLTPLIGYGLPPR